VLSVDAPVPNLFIVNNGDDRGVAEAADRISRRDIPNGSLFGSVVVEKFQNLGVAGSWNHIARTRPGPWFLVGNDIKFLPGDVAKTNAVLSRNADATIVHAMGCSAFVLTEVGVRTLGYFDENFYPAYFEDNDYLRRVSISGAKTVGVPDFTGIHGEPPHSYGSCTINSDKRLQMRNLTTFGNGMKYYIEKWGGEPAKEKFRTPFNRDVPLGYWTLDASLRDRNTNF
jgi:GT2 family glycosyltransferase